MSSGKAVNEAQRGTCSLTARGLPIQSSRAGTVYDISPQGTEKGLEVQYTMDHQVDAQMEVGEESNFNATEILTENTLKELFLVPAVREALALCHLRCVETGSYQIVKDKLHKLNFSTTALMGYVVGIANLQDHVNLTKDLKMSILGLRVLLPAARLKMPAGNLQMMQEVTVNNSIHVKDKAVDNANESTLWPCSAESHCGRWVIKMEKPVLLMDIEGSHQHTNKKRIQNLQRLDYIQSLLPEVVRLKAQLEVKVDIQPEFINLTVSIIQVLVCVRSNMVRKEKQTGHFPTRAYLSVVPVDAGLTGVTMTGSSRNTSVKVGVTEKVQAGLNANIKAAPSAGFNIRASKTTASEVEGKPWQLEQLSKDGDKDHTTCIYIEGADL
ncbi:unnamed protein product [Sphagnum jensenii]